MFSVDNTKILLIELSEISDEFKTLVIQIIATHDSFWLGCKFSRNFHYYFILCIIATDDVQLLPFGHRLTTPPTRMLVTI